MKNQFKEGDSVTAFNRKDKGRQKATVVSVYHGTVSGWAETVADVQFKDGTIQKGHLVGLLRKVA